MTARNGGGRSSAAAYGVRIRLCVSSGISPRRLSLFARYNYRVGCCLASPAHRRPRRNGESVAEQSRTILVCSCEDTMALDLGVVRRACRGANVENGRQLCRAELERARAVLATGGP